MEKGRALYLGVDAKAEALTFKVNMHYRLADLKEMKVASQQLHQHIDRLGNPTLTGIHGF